jgi:hypothetical protein
VWLGGRPRVGMGAVLRHSRGRGVCPWVGVFLSGARQALRLCEQLERPDPGGPAVTLGLAWGGVEGCCVMLLNSARVVVMRGPRELCGSVLVLVGRRGLIVGVW